METVTFCAKCGGATKYTGSVFFRTYPDCTCSMSNLQIEINKMRSIQNSIRSVAHSTKPISEKFRIARELIKSASLQESKISRLQKIEDIKKVNPINYC